MRLIDADAFKETLAYYIEEAGWSKEHNEALAWVKDEFLDSEPTIEPDTDTISRQTDSDKPDMNFLHMVVCAYCQNRT